MTARKRKKPAPIPRTMFVDEIQEIGRRIDGAIDLLDAMRVCGQPHDKQMSAVYFAHLAFCGVIEQSLTKLRNARDCADRLAQSGHLRKQR